MNRATREQSTDLSVEAASLPPDSDASALGACEDASGSIATPTEQLGRELAREMRRCWRRGERPAAEHFLRQHPKLTERREAAIELIYEEYCLRSAAGHDRDDVEQDLCRRFPQWAGPLGVMLECHRVLQSDRDDPQFPAVGDVVGEFRLTAELVHGSRGRVFLATQTTLADRPVVLKITPLDGSEHLSLARLQHTNIVPLHSVLDDAARGIRVLCMPYFGRTTLAALFQSLAGVPLAERTGRHIVDAIDRMLAPSSPQAAPAGAARQMLAHVSYVQALCWITASLADALEFAHERGLVHLDLKPSNVLLATDGQPMLLDFHLAREPVRPAGPLPENFGGTPGYMPPEQLAAMHALEVARPVDVAVDRRADIFALGAMLYESLGGQLPIGRAANESPHDPSAGSPAHGDCRLRTPLNEMNPQVSRGLSDIVEKCLAHRPHERYTHAAELADDLRRHWTDQPLVGVPNRSLAERWHKWRRRRPSTLRIAGLLGVVGGAVAILLAGTVLQIRDRRHQVESSLRDGQEQLHDGEHFAEAARSFERGLALAESLPLARELQRTLREQLATAKRFQVARQLHELADEIRALYGADSLPAERLRSLAAHGLAFWEKRHAIVNSLGSTESFDVNADLQDIAIFTAGLEVKLSADSDLPARRREAMRFLDEAEALFGPSAVLDHERRIHRNALGLTETSGPSSSRAASPAPCTAWQHYVLGRSFLASGDLPHADDELQAARRLDPAGRWPNFAYGLCAYRRQRFDDAVAAFSECIGAAPHVAGCYYNRALAYAALGRADDALHDYDRALELEPTHAAAALNRGVIFYERKQLENARADLRRALEHGADAPTVHYNLALVHLAASEPAAALIEVQDALSQNPSHELARRLRDTLERATERP